MRADSWRPGFLVLLLVLLAVWASPLLAKDSVSMRTIEGRVLTVDRHKGEGDLEVILARLEVAGAPEGGMPILLAPESVCNQLGFQIEEGDRLRARVFVSTDGPSRVQKVQNFTQGTMVRMRTLHSTPLWSTTGAWQGGPLRTTSGRHRHGQGRGGSGP